MDQIKVGTFLKELRNEKGLTQSELADTLFVSNRSVSRWEKGVNLPDIDILIELANFYDVKLIEILNGQRSKMDEKVEKTALKVAELENKDKERITRMIQVLSIVSVILMIISYILSDHLGTNAIVDFVYGFSSGFSFACMVLVVIVATGWIYKILDLKKRLAKLDSH